MMGNTYIRGAAAGAIVLVVIGLISGRGALLPNAVMGAIVGVAVSGVEQMLPSE